MGIILFQVAGIAKKKERETNKKWAPWAKLKKVGGMRRTTARKRERADSEAGSVGGGKKRK